MGLCIALHHAAERDKFMSYTGKAYRVDKYAKRHAAVYIIAGSTITVYTDSDKDCEYVLRLPSCPPLKTTECEEGFSLDSQLSLPYAGFPQKSMCIAVTLPYVVFGRAQ